MAPTEYVHGKNELEILNLQDVPIGVDSDLIIPKLKNTACFTWSVANALSYLNSYLCKFCNKI